MEFPGRATHVPGSQCHRFWQARTGSVLRTESRFATAGYPRAGHVYKSAYIHTQVHPRQINKSVPGALQGRCWRGSRHGVGWECFAGSALGQEAVGQKPRWAAQIGRTIPWQKYVEEEHTGRRFAKSGGQPVSSAASPAAKPGSQEPHTARIPGSFTSRSPVASPLQRLRPAPLRLFPPPADTFPPSPSPAAAAGSSGGGCGKDGGRDRIAP